MNPPPNYQFSDERGGRASHDRPRQTSLSPSGTWLGTLRCPYCGFSPLTDPAANRLALPIRAPNRVLRLTTIAYRLQSRRHALYMPGGYRIKRRLVHVGVVWWRGVGRACHAAPERIWRRGAHQTTLMWTIISHDTYVLVYVCVYVCNEPPPAERFQAIPTPRIPAQNPREDRVNTPSRAIFANWSFSFCVIWRGNGAKWA